MKVGNSYKYYNTSTNQGPVTFSKFLGPELETCTKSCSTQDSSLVPKNFVK